MADTKTELDLDINNYDLHDILVLFDIPMNFNEADLKRAKQMVLRTHPDKSKLSPDYFRFYSSAYKTLFSVWEFRKKGDVGKDNQNTEYVTIVEHDEKGKALGAFFDENRDLKKPDNFNDWFNTQFNNNKMSTESDEKGYDDWLRNEDVDEEESTNIKSMAAMGEEIEKRKTILRDRSLVVRKDIQDIWSGNSINSTDLSGSAPESFDSDMFSSLPYQDLQKAHQESVIPVTHQDYQNKQKFNSVNEMMMHRGQQDTKPLSEKQALEYLKERTTFDEESAVKRAYHLAKQTEEAERKNNEFWATIHQIKEK